MTRNIVRRAPISTKLYRDALPGDERTLTEKANDDAIMKVRGKINDLLSIPDSFDFVFAMTDAENGWAAINSPKYHSLALLVAAIDKASHTQASQWRLQKTIDAARAAGWLVTMDKRNVSVVSVEWSG